VLAKIAALEADGIESIEVSRGSDTAGSSDRRRRIYTERGQLRRR
jgi:hypothetical protein